MNWTTHTTGQTTRHDGPICWQTDPRHAGTRFLHSVSLIGLGAHYTSDAAEAEAVAEQIAAVLPEMRRLFAEAVALGKLSAAGPVDHDRTADVLPKLEAFQREAEAQGKLADLREALGRG